MARVSAKRKEAIRQTLKSDGEPTGTPTTTRSEMIKALHWYNLHKDEKVAAKYLNITDPALAKEYTSLAWALRMKTRGFTFNVKEEATISRMKAELDKKVNEAKKVEEKPKAAVVVSIQDRVQSRTDQYIGELEGFIDTYGILGKHTDMNAYKWMVDNEIKAMHASRIAEYFRDRVKEVFAAASGKDPELVEAYASYGKARLTNLLKCYAALIQDAEKIAVNQKTARKPRKKKAVPMEKRVSKLKYLVKEDKLKLQSIDPVKIMGAAQLWVYNCKTRKLGVYNAEDASGLSVKGSTIERFNGPASISKTLRKPEKVLANVLTGGKVVLRKVLDNINAKPALLNGRINKDTILLRVVS